jgi:hypothetical protein
MTTGAEDYVADQAWRELARKGTSSEGRWPYEPPARTIRSPVIGNRVNPCPTPSAEPPRLKAKAPPSRRCYQLAA